MKLFRMMTALLVMLGLLSGCGGGGDSSSADNGSVVIGITDAPGDFLAYAVDVKAIKLTHADGREVNALPQTTRIDFAQYVDLTEFVTAASVPNGRYTRAALELDYSNADIQVEDGNGDPVQAVVQDAQGNPITTLEVEVTLDGDHPLVIAPGVARHLTLDFDLQSSNVVDTGVNPPVVTVEPLLVADVEMKALKPYRLRGLFQSVDEAQSLIHLQLRPFQRRDGNFGSFDAYVNGSTSYEIDGDSYTGSAGLTQLALQQPNSWIVLFGQLDPATKHFVASEVYAGSSVPGSAQDAVSGVVTKRVGDQLTVRARMIVRTDGSLIFNKDVSVTLDAANTKVTRQLSKASSGIGDISVGQRLELLGTITENSGALSMNTTTHARMMLTFLSGTVNTVNANQIDVDLQHIEGLLPAAYDFAGTGAIPADDADPANYEIDTGSMDISGFELNDPVRVRGFVTPFGSAPADFTASTIVGLKDVPARFVAQWGPLHQANPFTSISDSGFVVDLSNSLLHHVWRYGVRTDLNGQTPTLQPQTSGNGLFAIQGGGSIQVYASFSDFEAALTARLAAGSKVKRLGALGSYDDTNTIFTATAINVVLNRIR